MAAKKKKKKLGMLEILTPGKTIKRVAGRLKDVNKKIKKKKKK